MLWADSLLRLSLENRLSSLKVTLFCNCEDFCFYFCFQRLYEMEQAAQLNFLGVCLWFKLLFDSWDWVLNGKCPQWWQYQLNSRFDWLYESNLEFLWHCSKACRLWSEWLFERSISNIYVMITLLYGFLRKSI